MLHVTGVLNHFKIHPTSVLQACQDVGGLIRDSADPLRTARNLVNDLLSYQIKVDDEVYARVLCKYIVKDVIEHQCDIAEDTVLSLIEKAKEYTDKFCADPKNSHLWSIKEHSTVVSEKKQVVEGLDTKVSVKSDGKIKKGGKQPLAMELYKKFVTDNPTPYTRKQFIDLLIKELDMTVSGASTYHYNCGNKWI